MTPTAPSKQVAIVGAGPAGLFAAEKIASEGHGVTVYDAMPSTARKFLMAGRGGLNLTHSEPLDAFLTRYSGDPSIILNAIRVFPPDRLVAWANALGAETFVGSSGRVFPNAMKASPLLRAWLRRLDDLGVVFRLRHRWKDFAEGGGLIFTDADGKTLHTTPGATLFALGGASWPRLGSDAAWVAAFQRADIAVTALTPANCAISISWSEHFAKRFAGAPLKRIAIACGTQTRRGEAIITTTGLEGGAIYALVPEIRKALDNHGTATLTIDMKPNMSQGELTQRLSRAKSGQSLSNTLRKAASLSPAAITLLHEAGPLPKDPAACAARIKGVSLTATGTAALARAISTAGGIALADVSPEFELIRRPGTFVAGEMLDWEAPTGGYLLQGVFATANAAAAGLTRHLTKNKNTT